MENLRLYKISDHYVHYLHSRDNKVPYNKGAKRPYVGIVFSFGGFNYYVPMANHEKIKPGKHIVKLDGGRYGLLGFNNMLPIHRDALIVFDISKDPDSKYRALLQHQISLCNRIKADILNHAQLTYFDVVNEKNKFLMSISCDFKKLEKACREYRPDFAQP